MISPYLSDEKYFNNIIEPYKTSLSCKEKHDKFIKEIKEKHILSGVKPIITYDVQKIWCDGLCLRGYMLAAMAYNEDIESVNILLDDLMTMTYVTGVEGRWVRDYIRTDTPSGQWMQEQINFPTCDDAYYFQKSKQDENYILWTDVSRDQIYGLLYGLTVTKKFINNQEIQEKVKHLSEKTLNQIINDGMALANPSGTLTRFNNVNPNSFMPENTFILLILSLLSDDFQTYNKYYSFCVKYILRYMPYDFTWFNQTNCNNQCMYNVGNFCLYLLTGGNDFKYNMKRQNNSMNKYCNSMWILHAYYGEQNIRDNDDIKNALLMINLFPSTKSLASTESNDIIEAKMFKNRYGQRTAEYAIHPAYNNDFFNWTTDTRNIDATEWYGNIQFAPSDYLIVYSLAKKMNLI